MARIQTALLQDVAELEGNFGSIAAAGCDAILLFSLGIAQNAFIPFARRCAPAPVFLADCYGILGFSPAAGKNRELMEAGRGREYGGVGGDGGSGVVAVALSGGGFVATVDELPAEATSHLAVVTGGGAGWLREHASAVYHGGVAKDAYRLRPESESFERVSHFFISTRPRPDSTVGTTSFTGDVKGSVRELLDTMPAGYQVDAVALFPCFMRGKNEYGVNDIEPDAIGELLPGVPLFGMFCHGELGPSRSVGFDPKDSPQGVCRQHSMTSIVAVYASRASASG